MSRYATAGALAFALAAGFATPSLAIKPDMPEKTDTGKCWTTTQCSQRPKLCPLPGTRNQQAVCGFVKFCNKVTQCA